MDNFQEHHMFPRLIKIVMVQYAVALLLTRHACHLVKNVTHGFHPSIPFTQLFTQVFVKKKAYKKAFPQPGGKCCDHTPCILWMLCGKHRRHQLDMTQQLRSNGVCLKKYCECRILSEW